MHMSDALITPIVGGTTLFASSGVMGYSIRKMNNDTFVEGETVGVLGANGAGKSTLMKLMTGLIEPGHGEIKIAGEKVNRKNLKSIRKRIGYTFQDSDHQLFMPSVYEDVAFALKQKKMTEADIEVKVNQVLKEVNGLHLKDKASNQLSGGEKRIATHDMDIALALCNRIMILHDGRVRADDVPMKIFEDSKLLDDNHLEMPLMLQGCADCANKE